jgi:hypothetical protein
MGSLPCLRTVDGEVLPLGSTWRGGTRWFARFEAT